MTGLFSVLDPFWAAADGMAAELPAMARLLLWGMLAGLASMLVYLMISPQRRLQALVEDTWTIRQAQRDGDAGAASTSAHTRRLLKNAVARFALTVLPTLAAALPVLFLVAFLDGEYGLSEPEAGAPVAIVTGDGSAIDVEGGQRLAAGWTVPWPETDAVVRISDASGRHIFTLSATTRPGTASVRNLASRLFGARAGELAPGSSVGSITIETTPRSLLQPELIARHQWVVPFLVGLMITSLLVKTVFRLH